MLETAFALKRLPECTSRHTGTLDSRRLGSAWAGRDEPSRLRAGPHVRGARYGLTVAQVGWLAATGFGQAQMGGRAGLGEST